MVDIHSLERTGDVAKLLVKEQCSFIVYDHHPANEHPLKFKEGMIEDTGAAITLLMREIMKRNLTLTSFESTLFALGLYTDTGSFTYTNTKPDDLKVASFLLENGANLSLVAKFSEQPLQNDEQRLLQALLENCTDYTLEGLTITIAHAKQMKYTSGLSLLARKILDMTTCDALFLLVEMGRKLHIVARSVSERINVLPPIKSLGGGGHQKAASALVKNQGFADVHQYLKEHLQKTISPSLLARDIMSSPVKIISLTTTIDTAAKMMLRYGHTGFPVVEDNKLVGIISRRDVDKAKHHGLGHAPVKGYMSKEVITIVPTTTIEELQEIMINKNVGRLPVIHDGKIVGIISRTNVIEALHGEKVRKSSIVATRDPVTKSLDESIYSLLSKEMLNNIQSISTVADELNYPVYLVGGIVRDLIIGRRNEDIDIVIEGDAITLANRLTEVIGGRIQTHERFSTATWFYGSQKIDLTSARTEFYDFPAALPSVECSSLKEDLYRRDFTINALAIQINQGKFGTLVDYFQGYQDIQDKKIRVLYNLSFVEDPTRILRAIRFENRFGFKMDSQTLELVQHSIDSVRSASSKRIAQELQNIFKEKDRSKAIIRLNELKFWSYLYKPIVHVEKKIKAIECFEKAYFHLEPAKSVPWICYLILIWSKREDMGFIKTYCLNNDELQVVSQVETLLTDNYFDVESNMSEFHSKLSTFSVEAILCFGSSKPLCDHTFDSLSNYLNARMNMPTLLNGTDLKKLNLEPGPIYSTILHEVECKIISGEIKTTAEALDFVKQKYC
ncbi:MAG: CBS domain-containing protein [Bacillaceae bacterium]|nr:CBS domain-containing protein [Bacillaceae bacterium]